MLKIFFSIIFICVFYQEVTTGTTDFVSSSYLHGLKNHDIVPTPRIISRRSSETDVTISLYFFAFHEKFHLFMTKSHLPIHKDFQIIIEKHDGSRSTFDLGVIEVYTGHLADNYNVKARAYITSTGDLSIYVDTDNDTLVLEPMHRHSTFSTNHSTTNSLVYRLSDVYMPKRNNTSFQAIPESIVTLNEEIHHERTRRSASSSGGGHARRTMCTLLLVADYRFFSVFGRKDKTRTSYYLLEMVDRVNHIFESSTFVDGSTANYTGYGFLVKDILIHTEPTLKPNHYNHHTTSDDDVWNPNDLLKSFGRHPYQDYCLAHLFTHQTFSNGLLGLSYRASDTYLLYGGICPQGYHDEYGYVQTNTGWTTYRDSKGDSSLTLAAHLTTAHELGHNWGSHHDPDTPECLPSIQKGGKYLMYAYDVSGYERNNRIFSPCSLRAIGAVLKVRAPICFLPPVPHGSYCGNMRIDPGETCDVGEETKSDTDSCCDKDCQLREHAFCSPVNHACCSPMCEPMEMGQKCSPLYFTNVSLVEQLSENSWNNSSQLFGGLMNIDCEPKSQSVCAGSPFIDCPLRPMNETDGKSCMEQGQCKNGHCIPFCETIGLKTCVCQNDEESCHICCLKSNTNEDTEICLKATEIKPDAFKDRSSGWLNDGRPCNRGSCRAGQCENRITEKSDRIWNYPTKWQIDTTFLKQFLWNNLVMATVFLTLLVWIPLCLIINHMDMKTLANYKQHAH